MNVDKLDSLPPIPPILQQELDEAKNECMALLKEYNSYPQRFGFVSAIEWKSELMLERWSNTVTQAFVERWSPLEQRYLRAREAISRYLESPQIGLDRRAVHYVLDRFGDGVLRAARRENYERTLEPHNAAKAHIQEIARSKAAEIWEADKERCEFRLIEVARIVKGDLEREGHKGLPKPDQIKKWIKSVAPDYASSPGRPRK